MLKRNYQRVVEVISLVTKLQEMEKNVKAAQVGGHPLDQMLPVTWTGTILAAKGFRKRRGK